MNFFEQVQLNQQINNMGVLEPSSPAAITYNNNLYLFYVGSGKNGIFYSVWNGSSWSTIQNLGANVGVGIATGTSPSCAVLGNELYVFYNGNGNNGVFYTVFNGSIWSQAAVVPGTGFLPQTSPSAVAYNGSIYVFWNGSGNNGIWFSSFTDGSWSTQTNLSSLVSGLGIASGTGPAACVFNEDLYVFYNGVGNNGTFYVSFSGQNWSQVMSVGAAIGGMNFAQGTSPAAATIQGGAALALLWNGSGADGIWYTTLDETGWQSPQQQLSCPNGPPSIMPLTSPAIAVFQNLPSIFWNGSGNNGIWATTQLNFTLAADTYAPIIDAMYNSYNFQVAIDDPATIYALSQIAPSLTGQVHLNNNSENNPPNPDINPPIPSGLFNGLSSTQITFLLTLTLGIIGYAIYRYNRVIVNLLGGVIQLELANNNNNPQPINIPLLPIQNANGDL